MSLEATDKAAQAVAVAQRVTLKMIEEEIAQQWFTTADRCIPERATLAALKPLQTMTICFLVMKNGYVVVGKSAPASPENFDETLGRQFAREDAIRQIWPLMGYELRS